MGILNYLLALSLVIVSVVKTADLFIKSDRSLLSLQEKFINSTRDLLKSNKGSISLVAALMTVILSSLLLFYITKMQIEFEEAKYRSQSYLCAQYLNIQTKKYIKEMAIFNWSLRAAFAAKNSVVAGVEGTVIWRGLSMARDARHYNYMRKLAKNKHCHLPETFHYVSNTPFKIKPTLGLVTNIDETSIVRQKEWDYQYYKIPKGIRFKKSFCLKSHFKIKDAWMPDPRFQSEEITADSLSLKCLSGFSS